MRESFGKRYGVLILLLVVGVLIVISLAAQLAFGPSSNNSLINRLADWYRALGMIGVFVSVGVMIASALTFLPAEAPGIANGAVYGVVSGAILSWVSGMIGANLAFAIGRLAGPALLRRFFNKTRLSQVYFWVRTRGGISLVIARFIPLFPFFLLNYGAGIAGMRVWTFNWATALGLMPACVVFAILGYQMGELSTLQGLLIAALTLGAIVLLVLITRRTISLPAE